MTPKETADLLINDMIDAILKEERGEYLPLKELRLCAKQCALIAVNEILNSDIFFIGKGSPAEKEFGEGSTIEHWQQVRDEINQVK